MGQTLGTDLLNLSNPAKELYYPIQKSFIEYYSTTEALWDYFSLYHFTPKPWCPKSGVDYSQLIGNDTVEE